MERQQILLNLQAHAQYYLHLVAANQVLKSLLAACQESPNVASKAYHFWYLPRFQTGSSVWSLWQALIGSLPSRSEANPWFAEELLRPSIPSTYYCLGKHLPCEYRTCMYTSIIIKGSCRNHARSAWDNLIIRGTSQQCLVKSLGWASE